MFAVPANSLTRLHCHRVGLLPRRIAILSPSQCTLPYRAVMAPSVLGARKMSTEGIYFKLKYALVKKLGHKLNFRFYGGRPIRKIKVKNPIVELDRDVCCTKFLDRGSKYFMHIWHCKIVVNKVCRDLCEYFLELGTDKDHLEDDQGKGESMCNQVLYFLSWLTSTVCEANIPVCFLSYNDRDYETLNQAHQGWWRFCRR